MRKYVFNSEISKSMAVEDEISVKLRLTAFIAPTGTTTPCEMRQCDHKQRRPISGYFLINRMSEIGNIGYPQLLGTEWYYGAVFGRSVRCTRNGLLS